MVVDWTHGNEELTDYELGPRGERVYFPSLLDQKCHDGHGKKKKKNKKTTKAAAAAAAAAAAVEFAAGNSQMCCGGPELDLPRARGRRLLC